MNTSKKNIVTCQNKLEKRVRVKESLEQTEWETKIGNVEMKGKLGSDKYE
jgi:hypothetical protein